MIFLVLSALIISIGIFPWCYSWNSEDNRNLSLRFSIGLGVTIAIVLIGLLFPTKKDNGEFFLLLILGSLITRVVLGLICSRNHDDPVANVVLMLIFAGILGGGGGSSGSSYSRQYELEKKKLRELEKINDKAREKMPLDEQIAYSDSGWGRLFAREDTIEDLQRKQLDELDAMKRRMERRSKGL